MPGSTPLDVIPLWALAVALLAANLVFDECGFRVGRLRTNHTEKESDAIVGAIVAAELGLLAFLLAFSFGVVNSRFDQQQRDLLDEANAIGTTYLRAAMLPEAQGVSVRRLLRDYADTRLQVTEGRATGEVLHRSEEIHHQLWTQALAAARQDTRSVPTGLFIESLNKMIDLHALRVMSVRNRMPLPVWLVLFAVGLLSFFTMGYQAGSTKARRTPVTVVVAVTFVAVLWLVADLDRPSHGFIRVRQEPLLDVRKMMADADAR
jgi:hypothetical protein